MLAFQVGDGPEHYVEAWGRDVDLTIHRRRPEKVTAMLADVGFHVHVTTIHEPADEQPRRQAAYLVARKMPVGASFVPAQDEEPVAQ